MCVCVFVCVRAGEGFIHIHLMCIVFKRKKKKNTGWVSKATNSSAPCGAAVSHSNLEVTAAHRQLARERRCALLATLLSPFAPSRGSAGSVVDTEPRDRAPKY